MVMNEPCPMCGDLEVAIGSCYEGPPLDVYCKNCGLSLPGNWKTDAEALAEWNERSLITARRTMAKHMKDPGLELSYVSNIACVLIDKLNIKDRDTRQEVSKEILELILGDANG